MKIKMIGGTGGEVTGSAYMIQTAKARLLVDCGMFQGGKKSEALNRPPIRPNTKLDAVLLTHGHLDYTGRLPLLAQLGYRGPVFATLATIEMSALIGMHEQSRTIGFPQGHVNGLLRQVLS